MNGSVLLQIIKAGPAAHKEKETTNQCTPKFMLSEILEHEKKTLCKLRMNGFCWEIYGHSKLNIFH